MSVSNGKATGIGCGVLAVFTVGGFVVGSLAGATNSTNAGQVAVVRNGGWFGGHNIRGTMKSGSSVQWVGLWTEVHKYPAQERYYTISATPGAGDKTGVDVANDPSSDGILMGIEGTFFFTLNQDPDTLKAFDNKFGTRTYKDADGKFRTAYDGDQGWSGYLDQVLRPVIDGALRQAIGNVPCYKLVSSCALVANGAQAATTASVTTGTPVTPGGVDLSKVQDDVNKALDDGMKATLGGEFFTNVHFTFAKAELPANVQDAVNKAQAEYANVAASQAKVLQAQADAQANETRQKGYNACPVCGQIDINKSIPGTITVWAPGANTTVPLTNGSGPLVTK